MIFLNENAKVIYHKGFIDYKGLRNQIDKLKALLNKNENIGTFPIGIMMERTPELLMIIVALLELEVPFVPMLPSWPQKRIDKLIERMGMEIIVEKKGKDELKITRIESNYPMEKDNKKLSDLAYILFTSGTTGEPKGVEVTRVGLENFVLGIKEVINFKPNEIIGCFTNYTFDIFILESVFALANGFTVVLADDEERSNPKKILKLIKENNISTIQMTPSGMKNLLAFDEQCQVLNIIEKFLIGGEKFPEYILEKLQNNTNAKIYNMYGPTETTIWSSVADLTKSKSINIGKPIRNTKFKILDADFNEVECGKIGEICILGDGLARGYFKDEIRTQQVFVKLRSGERVYRTGDYGKQISNKNYECLGRKDNQIKLHGHRIELEEIEHVMMKYEGVKDVAVCFVEKKEEKIVAFYSETVHVEKENLYAYLRDYIPTYMIPASLYRVEELIYNQNGKKSRDEMIKKFLPKANNLTVHKMNGTILNKVIGIFKKHTINHDNVFDENTLLEKLGIDSIEYVQIIADTEEEFAIEFDDDMLVMSTYKNILEYAKYVEEKVKVK